MPPALMGPAPPKAQPEPLFTGIAADHQHHCRAYMTVFVPYPASRLATCLLHLFQYVAAADRPQIHHLAVPLGIEELFLIQTTFVSRLVWPSVHGSEHQLSAACAYALSRIGYRPSQSYALGNGTTMGKIS